MSLPIDEYSDGAIQIECLSDFMKEIFNIRDAANLDESEEPENRNFYFRGKQMRVGMLLQLFLETSI